MDEMQGMLTTLKAACTYRLSENVRFSDEAEVAFRQYLGIKRNEEE
ncbi:MAG: hypothetical protein WAM14_00495 [Candidatus Nitrosopolaris sp.]